MISVASFLVAAAQSGAADWPTYRGDNSRRGATAESLPLPLARQWVHTSAHRPRLAWSGPGDRTIENKLMLHRVKFDDAYHVAVVGDRVFFGSSDDHQVRCVDAATGQQRWRFFTGGPVRLAPTVADERVYFGSDDGYAYCLNAHDGRLIWKLRAGPDDEWLLARGTMVSRWPVRTAVLIEGGVAYFGAGIFPHENIFLYAVSAATGKILWQRDNISQADAGRNDLTPQGYLLAEGDLLFVPSGRTLPAALDRRSGKILHKREHAWRSTAGGVVGGSRALLSDGQLYAAGPLHMLAMDQQTGDVGFGWFTGREMAIAGDAAYVATGQRIARLDRAVYAEASRQQHKLQMEIDKLARSVANSQGQAVEPLRSRLNELRAEHKTLEGTGVVWEVPSELHATLIVAGPWVLAGGENVVVALDIASGQEAWRAEVDGEARGLAVAGGRLYVSTTSGSIHCFAPGTGPEISSVASQGDNATGDVYASDPWTGVYESAAKAILARTGIQRGYCLVVGSEEGRLAYELARRSELNIYCVEPDETKVAKSRRVLASAGLYGSRVTVHHGDFSDIPYANFFANLIVSDRAVRTGSLRGIPSSVVRHLKPWGGAVCLGRPVDAPGASMSFDAVRQWFDKMQLGESGSVSVSDSWATLVRGALPGAGSWTHQYGEPGNTAASEDVRIQGGLGVLWYGDPGPDLMVNRHEGAVGPLSINGRLFVQGQRSVVAYDAHNGLHLWTFDDPEAIRTGVFRNESPGNLAASEDAVFVIVRDVCVELDAATGKVRATHTLPQGVSDATHQWGYVAVRDGRLFGTATRRKEIEQRQRRRGKVSQDATDVIFAIDTLSGKILWNYQGNSISHRTIALGVNRVFFVDSSITSAQRAVILDADKTGLADLRPEEVQQTEAVLKKRDLRLAVALDASTGDVVWSRAVDVTDCSDVGTGGGKLTLMQHNGVLVFCGANANGHYWRQFVAGEFSQRRLVALDAEDGNQLWSKDANYRHRPIVVGDQIVAEPWSFNLFTGVQKTRLNILTNEPEPWSIMRTGHHCGMITGTPHMLLFRSGFTGFYDLDTDVGEQHFAGHRLGCWINAIPAGGLVIIPEASAGCVCLFSIASTVVLEPRPARNPWAIYSSVGETTPVRHVAINLGAPGDRRDARGTVWLAYPRPVDPKRTSLDLSLDIAPVLSKGGGYESLNSRLTEVEDAETSWVYSSWVRGMKRCTIPLLGGDDEPAEYTLRLHFAENGDAELRQRLFDVRVQGETVLDDFDIVAAAGGAHTALVREVTGVRVKDVLSLELIPSGDAASASTMPILSGIEVIRNSAPSRGSASE